MKKESKLYVLLENDIRIDLRRLVNELDFFMQKESKIYVLLENGVRIPQGRLVRELKEFSEKFGGIWGNFVKKT